MRDWLTRRQAMGLGVSAVSSLVAGAGVAQTVTARRTLRFENLHTGEKLAAEYWANGSYLIPSLKEINRILRDHRTGDVHAIDLRLLDLLYRLRRALGTSVQFQIISGYRSPKTNAALARAGSGVARNSLHTHGMAIDIRVPDRPLHIVRNAALAIRGGGVGFYPGSDFVHVDVGRVRAW